MRRAARRDANEQDIIDALEKAGFSVERLSQAGLPDLLLSKRSRWFLAEVKLPLGPRGGSSDRELTEAQEAFKARHQAPFPIFRSPLEALTWAMRVM